ncbi:hypothetical protein ACGFJ7_41875 [Actinoplanes sp. NPDC048988]|uniref:hypothetical protein n=1 Tax=Actinoplanes sp. NPDC048988 TaxID=3363901 RepID=UPI00372295BC
MKQCSQRRLTLRGAIGVPMLGGVVEQGNPRTEYYVAVAASDRELTGFARAGLRRR